MRQTEASVEQIRQANYDSGEQVNQAQGQLYQASAEVGRLEAEIRFVVEGRQRAQERLLQIQTQTQHWTEQASESLRESESLEENRASLESQVGRLQDDMESLQLRLPDVEQVWTDARQQVQDQTQQVNQVQQQMKVLAAEQRGLQEQIQTIELRLEGLQTDRDHRLPMERKAEA